jgi:hypothetical protein
MGLPDRFRDGFDGRRSNRSKKQAFKKDSRLKEGRLKEGRLKAR